MKRNAPHTPLTRLFDTANAKVLDFLLVNEGLKYRQSDISELTGVPVRTLRQSLKLLLDEKVIKRSRQNQRTYYYTADLSSPRVGGLLSYMDSTLSSNLDAIFKKNKRR